MSKISQILGLDKIKFFRDAMKEHGGVLGVLYTLYRMDDVKVGRLVGEDQFGNKYYENKRYFYGRNRWVVYSDKNFGMDYDASQVPPEWYGWLHYKTDLLPKDDPSRPKYPWMFNPGDNPTGTSKQYVPYSTTRPKIEPWIPPKKVK